MSSADEGERPGERLRCRCGVVLRSQLRARRSSVCRCAKCGARYRVEREGPALVWTRALFDQRYFARSRRPARGA